MTNPTALDQLKKHSLVVADTGKAAEIDEFAPRDVTTNPSLILASIEGFLQNPSEDSEHTARLKSILDEAVSASSLSTEMLHDLKLRLSVATGLSMLARIPGRISTEVPASCSFDTSETIRSADKLMALYHEAGVDASRILIKIAGTWEGLMAAKKLEARNIHTNVTLLFSLEQALVAADVGVTLISPFVGRVTDWHKQQDGRSEAYPVNEDPGIAFVREVYRELKARGAATEVMAASFRSLEQILGLAGCDLLTIAPKLLRELHARSGDDVTRAITVADADTKTASRENKPLSEADFRWALNENAMATENLRTGISLFHAASVHLDKMLCTLEAQKS